MEFHNNTVDLNHLWYESHKDLLEKTLIEVDCLDQFDVLCNKLLGEQLKIKKRIDPNKPKKARTSFMYFCDEHRNKIKNKNPNLKLGGIMKELGSKWKNLSDKQKTKYTNLYEKDKERYEEAMDEYENKY